MLAASDLASWNLAPLQLVPTVLLSYAYFRRTRTLARRGTPVPGWRQFVFWLGIFLLVLAVNSPIDELGESDFFFVHMTQHILLGDLAPLCFVVGPDGAGAEAGARDQARSTGCGSSRTRFVALPIWALNLYLWHVPFLYEAALNHSAVHALEHILFFTCGAIMWAPVVETLPGPAWFGTGWKLGYVALVPPDRDRARQRLHLVDVGLLPGVRAGAAEVGDRRRARPEPRRGGDDGRGRADHARVPRVPLPQARGRGRAAPGR